MTGRWSAKPSRALWLPLTLVAVAALALTSCGVPTDEAPQALPRQNVPFHLLNPPNAAQGTSTTGKVPVQIYLVRGTALFPVSRLSSPPGSLQHVLDALLTGPTTDEVAAGLRTAIGQQITLRSAGLAYGLAVVDLSSNFGQIVGHEQILAVAQIVFTATALPGVTAVDFELDGKPVPVPTGEGALVQRSLTRADFPALAPPG